MFKINRKIEYALIALKYMLHKSPGQLTTAKEICQIFHVPFDPTSRVLQILTQSEILHAEQGAKGGYTIIRDLSTFSLLDLSKIISGPIEITNCFHSDYSNCEITNTCQIIAPMLNLNENINELFSTIMVSDLIKSKNINEKNIREKEIAKTK